jgi:hypothetical protein
MSENNLKQRIERTIKIVAKQKGLSEEVVNSIINLVNTVREDGAIDDDSLLSFFELVGDE